MSLRLIFWGILICLVDVTLSKPVDWGSVQFDLVHDFIGMLLMVYGTIHLSKIKIGGCYPKSMSFVKNVTILGAIDALHEHFIYEFPLWVLALRIFYFFASLVAIIVFCVAMRYFSQKVGFSKSIKRWKTTGLLFWFIYLIPFFFFCLIFGIAILAKTSINYTFHPFWMLVLLPVTLTPWIHGLVSLSTMKSEAQSMLRFCT
ncbi:hypothetical protein [Oxynema aestuarii]|uniref:Uncharacterized protein n=1 Tax=Oxynema aestuarii AP17 TaxID=2064643 RepID=A0A6H1TXR6_9CYAN|nr:hypothetical protein [Oxynema aestuarii]QIZ71408.1 hypothetical protein HCG48_13150 [Oxynema aestuarii AP17]